MIAGINEFKVSGEMDILSAYHGWLDTTLDWAKFFQG